MMLEKKDIGLIGSFILLMGIIIWSAISYKKDFRVIPATEAKEFTKIASTNNLQFEKDEEIQKNGIKTKLVEEHTHKIEKNINEEQLYKKLKDLLSGDIKETDIFEVNMKKILNCNSCLYELKEVLLSEQTDSKIIEKLVQAISVTNNVKSIDFLLSVLEEVVQKDDKDKLTAIQSGFADFDSPEIAIRVASFLSENSNELHLPSEVEYALKKSIFHTADRTKVTSHLVRMYENASDEETKNYLTSLDYPQINAQIAANAYNQGDEQTYKTMVKSLKQSSKPETVDAFMQLVKKSDMDSVSEVDTAVAQWSQNNNNLNILEIAQDYLSKPDATQKERKLAAKIVSSIGNTEQISHILNKAIEYEEDVDVAQYISEQIDAK